jgi:hypothetical protein
MNAYDLSCSRFIMPISHFGVSYLVTFRSHVGVAAVHFSTVCHATFTFFTYLPQIDKARCQETKLHGVKEIRLATTIASNDGIRGGRERLNLCLLPEGSKVGDCNLFDMHLALYRGLVLDTK